MVLILSFFVDQQWSRGDVIGTRIMVIQEEEKEWTGIVYLRLSAVDVSAGEITATNTEISAFKRKRVTSILCRHLSKDLPSRFPPLNTFPASLALLANGTSSSSAST